jgi:hypothetical protein
MIKNAEGYQFGVLLCSAVEKDKRGLDELAGLGIVFEKQAPAKKQRRAHNPDTQMVGLEVGASGALTPLPIGDLIQPELPKPPDQPEPTEPLPLLAPLSLPETLPPPPLAESLADGIVPEGRTTNVGHPSLSEQWPTEIEGVSVHVGRYPATGAAAHILVVLSTSPDPTGLRKAVR